MKAREVTGGCLIAQKMVEEEASTCAFRGHTDSREIANLRPWKDCQNLGEALRNILYKHVHINLQDYFVRLCSGRNIFRLKFFFTLN